jgi:hypothetical protein
MFTLGVAVELLDSKSIPAYTVGETGGICQRGWNTVNNSCSQNTEISVWQICFLDSGNCSHICYADL